MRRMTEWVAVFVCVLGLIGAAPIPSGEIEEASYGSEAGALESVSMRISMEFENAQLQDVLKVFSQQTGVNLIANDEVGDRLVTLYLEDVTVLDALDQILASSNLMYERAAGSNIYLIKPRVDEVDVQQTITRVYPLKYARVSTSTLARASSALASYVPAGGESVVVSVGLAEGSGVDQVLEGLLTDFGSVEIDPRTNTLIVTDLEENFPRLEATLRALDLRTPQILIEVEVLETAFIKEKDLGVEWGAGTPPLASFTLGADRRTRFPFGIFGDRVEPSITLDPTATDLTSRRGFGASILSVDEAKGILEALERDTNTVILARPRVLTLDNERAIIELATDEAISFTSKTDTQTGQKTTTVERSPTGVFLVVTPQINQGDELTLMVEPTVSKTVLSSIQPPSDQGSTIRNPKVRSTRTVVRMKSGETLVLGGLIDRDESEIISRIPGLSGIPFIGGLFTHRDTDTTTTELIVFVTPTILRDAVDSPQVVGALMHNLTDHAQEGVQSRQGLMEQALERLEDPRF